VRIEREQRFQVPVETGFAFITDPANWPRFWPGFVRLEPASRWAVPGDEAGIVVKLLGRDVDLRMTLRRVEENRLVEYDSRQPGLPDARHERHFSPAGDGFDYGLVVEYEPRSGFRGIYDRVLVRRGVDRALRQTLENLLTALPGA